MDEANVEDAITCQKPRNFKRVHPEFFKCNGNIIERTRTADRKESDSTNALQQENALTLSKMEPMENARAPKRRLKIVHAHNTQGEENYLKIYFKHQFQFHCGSLQFNLYKVENFYEYILSILKISNNMFL